MRRQYSFTFLSETGEEITQFIFSNRFLIIICCFIVIGMAAFPFFLSNYYQLRKMQQPNNKNLARVLEEQKKELERNKCQLKYFTTQINTLKKNLNPLKQSEHKVRLIANLTDTTQQNSIFGVGGSLSGDAGVTYASSMAQQGLSRKSYNPKESSPITLNLQKEPFDSLLKCLGEKQNFIASTPTIYPVIGWETSGFGYRKSPFTGKREFHKGMDIAAANGTPVIAPAKGTISYAGEKGLWGRTLIISHGHGMSTRYLHLSEIVKQKGDQVTRGELVARVGSTGRSIGPHLHYEVRLNGIPINPSKYILFKSYSAYRASRKTSEKAKAKTS